MNILKFLEKQTRLNELMALQLGLITESVQLLQAHQENFHKKIIESGFFSELTDNSEQSVNDPNQDKL